MKTSNTLPLPWYQTLWKQWYHATQNNRLPHALLLQAPCGAGKSELVRQFSRLLLCIHPTLENHDLYRSCSECQSCRWHAANTHPNYYVIEGSVGTKSSTISIEQIRELTRSLQQTATHYLTPKALIYHTVVVIDPMDDLLVSAQNAFLKTLEEPQPGVLFLLTNTRPATLLPTIKSRCQSIILPQPSLLEAKTWMQSQRVTHTAIDEKQYALSIHLAHRIPTKALAFLEKNETVLYQSIVDTFIQLGLNQIRPGKAAEQWSEYSIEKIVDYLMETVVQLIEIQLKAVPIDSLSITCDKSPLQQFIGTISNEVLFNYWDQLQLTKNEIQKYSLNSLITLEDLAYTFSNSCSFSSAR